MSDKPTCRECDVECEPEWHAKNDGYCEDCIFETLDPEWVREHYPDVYWHMHPDGHDAADAEEEEEERPAKARRTARRCG